MPETTADQPINPAIGKWAGPLGLPEFGKISEADLEAAIDVALPAHLAEIDAIASASAAPTFENTVIALELAGPLLSRASAIFWNIAGANTNDALQALERKLAPEMARHHSAVTMNAALFQRIEPLCEPADARQGLLLRHSRHARRLLFRWRSMRRRTRGRR